MQSSRRSLSPSFALALTALGCAGQLLACSSDPAASGPGIGGAGAPASAGNGVTTGGGGLGGSPTGGVAATGGAPGAGGGGAGGLAGSVSAAGSAGSPGASGSGGSGGVGAANAFTGTAQLMVLGSSNELDTCWRALFWKTLQDASITDFDLVGGVNQGPDCGVAGYDKDLQAQSGIIVTNLTAQQFAGWFTAHPPDALLVHFGGADLLQNMPIPGIMSGYTLSLEQARLVNPKVRFLIGQHTPMTSATCNDCANTVPQLNAAITAWAAEKSQPTSPVVVVDLLTGMDPAVDTSDGIHLNMVGSAKVAARFFSAIDPFFAK